MADVTAGQITQRLCQQELVLAEELVLSRMQGSAASQSSDYWLLAAQGFRLLGAHLLPAQGLQGLAAMAWPESAMASTVADTMLARGR